MDHPATESQPLLSKAFLDLYVPHLKQAQTCLKELTDKQTNVLDSLEVQTRNYSEHSLKSTAELMSKITEYKSKVISIRKRMLSIHQRTQSLKKRAIFIKDFKTKELEEKLRKRRQEEALIGDHRNVVTATPPANNSQETDPSIVFTI